MIVLIDNYDSFTFNLYQYLSEFTEVKVFRNDEITIEEIKNLKPEGIVISPGPGRPEDAGISIEVIKNLGVEIPVLGICLGHQAIASAFGGGVVRAKKIFHGKSSKIQIRGNDIFEGISRKLEVMRYHSLVVEKESLPEEIEVIGETVDDEVIMAIKHKKLPIYGLQFHPESIFTPKGKRMLKNFVEGICNEN
ncbi:MULTISPECIES: aminodeoxychorismate/anthranilate synthase component II [Clostridium]|uniref:Aminodeoxychorismate/anthranilate synthase component II n=1 Tax=Clostridium cibarium TaxID=2762247 RepID=A0ABR8PYJ2_9CLOT|nr:MULTISPECIES: aminodeoxychorismate/anthranilate synthase component II [Clostridium]MBD7913234.1 aminodeoxychorismate/anthranilate synthase component II [Clostridium cibarium]